MSEPEVAPRRTPRPGRPVKGDRRERALLDTAQTLLVAGRFADASVSDIAEAAGISRAGFYFYYASKQALLASVISAAVEAFNTGTTAALAPGRPQRPGEALAATVQAAVTLWWEHRAVMVAAFELGATIPEVYDRTMQNFAVVREPTVALVRRVGTVPESADAEEADRLVQALILMTERSLYDLMRGDPSAEDRDRMAVRLIRIWTRSLGIEA